MNFKRGWDRLCKVALILGFAGAVYIWFGFETKSDRELWVLIAIFFIPFAVLKTVGWIVEGFVDEPGEGK